MIPWLPNLKCIVNYPQVDEEATSATSMKSHIFTIKLGIFLLSYRSTLFYIMMESLPCQLCHQIELNNPQFFYRMRTTHMTHSKVYVPKGNMSDPPKGTHREFASTKLASSSKIKKGKAIKCSITGIGRPMSTMSKLPCVPRHHPVYPQKLQRNTNN